MASVVVVYHSGFGHTKAIAEHVLKGAASVAGVSAQIISVDELPAPDASRTYSGKWAALNSADAIIMGTPTYMGALSAPFKKFMEDSSAIWYRQGWRDKLAAGFTNSGGLSGDKLATLNQLATFANQHSMLWVSTGVMPKMYVQGETRDLNRLSSFSGLMTQADQGPPDQTPPLGDRQTAEVFGSRVAEAALRWVRGRK